MKFDKTLLTKIVNEMQMKTEVLRQKINTSSNYLTADKQEPCELFLLEFHDFLKKMDAEVNEFYEKDNFLRQLTENSSLEE